MDTYANSSGPALIACLADFRKAHPKASLTTNNCTGGVVTDELVSFLNLTSAGAVSGGVTWPSFIAAYCVNPPPDDGCPFGACPNSDIAGLFVRIATYVTALCTSTLVVCEPEGVDIEEAMWGHLALLYSQLISALVAIRKHQLTRLHTIVVALLCGSPMMMQLIYYSVARFPPIDTLLRKHGWQVPMIDGRESPRTAPPVQTVDDSRHQVTDPERVEHIGAPVQPAGNNSRHRFTDQIRDEDENRRAQTRGTLSIARARKDLTSRALPYAIIGAVLLWLAIMLVGFIPSHAVHYAQRSCHVNILRPAIAIVIMPIGYAINLGFAQSTLHGGSSWKTPEEFRLALNTRYPNMPAYIYAVLDQLYNAFFGAYQLSQIVERLMRNIRARSPLDWRPTLQLGGSVNQMKTPEEFSSTMSARYPDMPVLIRSTLDRGYRTLFAIHKSLYDPDVEVNFTAIGFIATYLRLVLSPPLCYLMYIGLVEFCYVPWIVLVELSVQDIPDHRLVISFGQVLALLASAPAAISVVYVMPELARIMYRSQYNVATTGGVLA